MAEKQNIFLIGPMGAGKSTIGRHLANHLRMEFFDSDHEIESRTGVNIAWIFDMEGEVGFRDRETKIIDELTQLQGVVVATGGGSILSKENRAHLSARGTVIYLKTSLEKQLARTQKDKKRPLLQVSNVETVLQTLAEERNPLYDSIADLVIEAEESSAKSVTNYIIKQLEESTAS